MYNRVTLFSYKLVEISKFRISYYYYYEGDFIYILYIHSPTYRIFQNANFQARWILKPKLFVKIEFRIFH